MFRHRQLNLSACILPSSLQMLVSNLHHKDSVRVLQVAGLRVE